MTATHPHRRAGGDSGIDQPGLRRCFRARGGLSDLAADTCRLGRPSSTPRSLRRQPGDDTPRQRSWAPPLPQIRPVEVPAVSTHKKLVFATRSWSSRATSRARPRRNESPREFIVGPLPVAWTEFVHSNSTYRFS